MFRHYPPRRLFLCNLSARTKPSQGQTFPRVRGTPEAAARGWRSRAGLGGRAAAASRAAARKDATPPPPPQREGTLPAPAARRPSDSLLLLLGKGEDDSRARSAEAQRRDAGRGAARQPRGPRTRPWVWPGSPHQFCARGGAGNGPERAAAPEKRARPRASCHSPFEMLDDLLFPHILR